MIQPILTLFPLTSGGFAGIIEPAGQIKPRFTPEMIVFLGLALLAGLLWWAARFLSRRVEKKCRAERSVREREDWHRTILTSIGDAVIATDVLGRVTFMNSVAEILTGWSEAEALERPSIDVFRSVREVSREEMENPVLSSTQEHLTVGLAEHLILIARDGTERLIDSRSVPIRDGAVPIGSVLIFRDLTDRRRRERELETQERQFRTLAESIPQLTWMAEPDGNIFWYNRRWYDYTGTTLEQMQGWGWTQVHDPNELPKVIERWQASIASGKPFDMVFPLRGKDEVFRPFLTRVMPVMDDDGHVSRWFGTNTDITETKRAEEELRDARSRLESTLSAGEVGTWEYDVNANVVRADRNLARFFGVTPEEAEGGPLESYTKFIHADDRDRVAQEIREALEIHGSYESEYRVVQADRTVRWVVARGRVERDPSTNAVRMPGVVVDISVRKRAEEHQKRLAEEASAANAKFEAFFEQGALFAGIMDVNGTILRTNRLAWEGCGYTLEQIEGKLFWEGPWWSPSAALVAQIKEASIQAANGEAFRAELPYFIADGSQRMVDLLILPITDESGKVVFLAPTGRDITEGKMAEAERLRLENDLRQMAADLSEADHLKDEFLATLAHELRNPLAPIRNGLQIMKMAGDDRQIIEDSRALMERQVKHMVRLIDDLMDVSRITQNKMELRCERVDLATVVQNAVETSRPLVEASNHTLTLKLPAGPIHIDADVTRLAQVFSNLINNAAKYTEDGGIIALTADREKNEVVISIRDNGIGIPPEMLPKVFAMFTQVDRSLERSQGGLGIGLSLVKNLVELHGGSVEARSDGHGLGSEFRVRLPIPSKSPETATSAEPARSANFPRSSFRILVVDDNQDSARSLARLLKLLGHEIQTANDGGEAVRVADEFRPQLIFLDIGLPVMNGYDVARVIRGRPWGAGALIVAMTGWGQEGDRNRSKEAGIDRHLVKPVDPLMLEQLLQDFRPGSSAPDPLPTP